MFLLIDNYDSFTYNLVQAFQKLGHNPLVLTNDNPRILELVQSSDLKMLCLSPGPGHPSQAGYCLEALKILPKHIPVLGVCLGHQALGLFGGAKVHVGPVIMHGKSSPIEHDAEGIFDNISNPMQVGRYHSLVVDHEDENALPFKVTARGPLGEIMALQYKDRPWVGVQFHPESVLTPEGLQLLGNFPQKLLAQEDRNTSIQSALECLARSEDLPASIAANTFAALMDGDMSPVQAGSFLMGLRMKGESAIELAEAARTALARAVPVAKGYKPCIDVVGTGGDGKASFNCSTATALILAGMGYRVLKHGNRSVSSPCGSADALEALGIPLDLAPEKVQSTLDACNFAFLFAPRYHPAFGKVAPLRKELGLRTLFNVLGPLINPAMPSHMLLGVANEKLLSLVATSLCHSSVQRAAVVHGAGDYDELTPLGINNLLLVDSHPDNPSQKVLSPMHINPLDFGIAPCSEEDLAVHDKTEAVLILRKLLHGEGPKAMQDMLILNVGMGIYLLEKNLSLNACMAKAREGIVSSAARKVLHAA